MDFVRGWSDKTDIPVGRFLPWIGIGSSKFQDWKLRFGKVNEHNAWVPRDHWLTADEKQRIVAFARANPLEGYRRLTFMMLDADQVACSPTSVYRVLKSAGLLAGASPNVTKKGTGFVQPLKPHEHWHVDVCYLNIADTFYFLCSILHYNTVRLHSAVGYVSPKDKLDGRDKEILAARDRKLAEARERRKLLRQAQHDAPPCPPALTTPAIDFDAVRAAITMAAVLQLLGCNINSKSAQHRGPCPLHGSTSGTSRSFSANLEQHIFHCFRCGRSGNALDLWAQANQQSIYDAAIDLCARLHIPLPTLPPPKMRNRDE